MNILFLAHSCLATGAERVLIDVMNIISIEDNHLFLVLPVSKQDNFSCLIDKSKNVRIKKIPYKNISSNSLKSFICFLYNIWGIIVLLNYMRKQKIDLLYINTGVNLLGVLLLHIVKIKVIWHIHEQPNKNTKLISRNLQGIYRRSFKLNSKITLLFTSLMAKEKWEKELNISIKKFLIANPPVRDMSFSLLKTKKESVVFGYLGTLHQSKNILMLIDCFSILKNETKLPIMLLICGDGPLLPLLKNKVEQLGIIDYVQFVRYTDNVISFYSQIDVLIQPSFNESWGMVVVEAIALKIPTIVTCESGVAKILEQNVESLIINPTLPSDLYDKMKILLSEDVREKIKKKAYEKYEKLDITSSFYKVINYAIFSKQ